MAQNKKATRLAEPRKGGSSISVKGSAEQGHQPAAHTHADEIPEGFTLSLALVDALPVLFFCLAAIVLGSELESPLFVAGAIVAFCGGAGKVAWKLVIALAHKNISLLNRQMRIVMPVGFALMIAGAVLRGDALRGVLGRLAHFPSVAFLLLWIGCMVAMGYFAGHRKQNDAHSNWVEQGVNAVGQAALLLALVCA